jgi:hypothetical protein
LAQRLGHEDVAQVGAQGGHLLEQRRGPLAGGGVALTQQRQDPLLEQTGFALGRRLPGA